MSGPGQEAGREEADRASIDRAIELAEEVEASGDVTDLERSRAILHEWIDQARAVVAMPGLGRVGVIQPDGRMATISSPGLSRRLASGE